MRRFLFGFVLGIALTAIQGANAQHDSDLTVREILEVIAEFDVKHADQQPFFPPAYGATNFASKPPTIWLFNGGPGAYQRQTAIHELIHVRCHRASVECPEEFVAAEEARQYQKFFVGVQ